MTKIGDKIMTKISSRIPQIWAVLASDSSSRARNETLSVSMSKTLVKVPWNFMEPSK